MAILPAQDKTFEVSVPVLIIGAGACGCTAALAVREHGIETMILERDDKPHGNTALSGSQIPAAGTKVQKVSGEDDTPEILAEDLIRQARGESDAEMVHHVSRHSAKTIDWLMESHEMPLSLVNDFYYPGHSRHHMHASPSRFGVELLTMFLDAVARAGVEIVTSAPVTDLYADADGRVRGVRITRPDGKFEDIGCDALILACNGFGGSREMMQTYIPEMVDAYHHGHDGNQGDAIRWGLELGAAVADMESYQGHASVTTKHGSHIAWPSITEGGYQVNAEGERFADESEGYSEQAVKVIRQTGHVAWVIFDERCHEIAMQFQHHRTSLEQGAIKSAANVAELAKIVGAPKDVLAKTIEDVAAAARGDRDDPLGRDFTGKPELKPPYRVAEVTGALFHTQGGLVVDQSARVLREGGKSLPNLFAGGGAARGLSGPSDWGYLSGSGLLMATVLGHLAGDTAASQIKKSA